MILARRDQLLAKIPEEKVTPVMTVRRKTSTEELPVKEAKEDETPVVAAIEEVQVQENLKGGALKNPERPVDSARATAAKVTFQDPDLRDDENAIVKEYEFPSQASPEPLAELPSQEPIAAHKSVLKTQTGEKTPMKEPKNLTNISSPEKNLFADPSQLETPGSDSRSGQPKSKGGEESRSESDNGFKRSVGQYSTAIIQEIDYSEFYEQPIFGFRWKHCTDGAGPGKLEIEETDDVIL